jgi:hypothetical protein
VNVHFAGRLGTYRYLDMHQAIGVALKRVPAVHGWIESGRTSPLGDWRLAIGDWRLAIGDWRLAIGDWMTE